MDFSDTVTLKVFLGHYTYLYDGQSAEKDKPYGVVFNITLIYSATSRILQLKWSFAVTEQAYSL